MRKMRRKRRKRSEKPMPVSYDLGDYRHKQPVPIVQDVDGKVMLAEPGAICLDDRCTRIEIHAAHPIYTRTENLFEPCRTTTKNTRHGETLRVIVVKHVPLRQCKVFREIYEDVVHDYGSFISYDAGVRAVWRAIAELLARDEIVSVRRPGAKFRGGYVRSGSPLLADPDGRRFLLTQLEEKVSG